MLNLSNWIKQVFATKPVSPIRRIRPGAELFEERTLPSPTMTLNAITHTLMVNGTASADLVKVNPVGKDIRVNVNGHVHSYAQDSVSQIDIDVGKGKDTVINNTKDQVNVSEVKGSKVTVGGKGLVELEDVDTNTGTSTKILNAFLEGTTGASGEVITLSGGTSVSVVVTGLTASTTYTVDLGTTNIGTFTTDSSGNAVVTLDNVTATIAPGTTVNILDPTGTTVLSGTLKGKGGEDDDDDDHDHGDHDDNDEQSSAFTATLTSTTSGVTGTVTAQPSMTSTGAFDIQVIVSGLSPNATYTLDVGGTSVGAFVTGSTGAANLTLNDVSTTIASGTAVTVLDTNGNTVLSGNFLAPSGDGDNDKDDVLAATLTGSTSGATGTVTDFPTDNNNENLQVVVSGLTANTTYTVDIGTTSVGTFNTDSTGAANITLNDLSASINSGMAVSILDANGNTVLSGNFASLSNGEDDDDQGENEGGDHDHDHGQLAATLTGSTSGVTGTVTDLSDHDHDSENLQVVVSGLKANTTYTLDIGTMSVGTFNTDSTGAANITLNHITASISSSTAVSIVDASGATELSGTFASPNSGFGDEGGDGNWNGGGGWGQGNSQGNQWN